MSNETILITRPKNDGQSLADALQAHGYRIIHEPLMEIFLLHTQRQALHNALMAEPDAVIVTSRHGAQALALLSDLRDPFLICVGEATAHTAHSLGFTRVATAGGTAQSLIDTIAGAYDEGSRFLYVSGEHVRVDFETMLANMHIERLILYEAVASPQLSDTLVAQLERKQIDAVTFFSPRAAELFTTLLARAGASQTAADLSAFCLSEAVAEPLTQPWKAIHVAREPTLASLVECVDNIFSYAKRT